jgi:chromosome segregation ATPase
MLQQELRSERDQNEQTIESFTMMCQDLKFKGMDEVEDLQSELNIIRDQMRVMAHIRAQKEVQIDQLQDQVRSQDQENMELREELRDLKFN